MGMISSLTKEKVDREFDMQFRRTESKYMLIMLCSAAVIGVAIGIVVFIVSFSFYTPALLLLYNKFAWTGLVQIYSKALLGSLIFMVPAAQSVLAIVAVLGPLTFLAAKILDAVHRRFQERVTSILSGLEWTQAVDHTRLVKLLKLADRHCLRQLTDRMDFQQLQITKQTLGEKKSNNLIASLNTPNALVLKNLLIDINSLNHPEQNNLTQEKVQKLQERFSYLYGKNGFLLFQSLILQQLRKGGHVIPFIHCLRRWSGISEVIGEDSSDAQLMITIESSNKQKNGSVVFKTKTISNTKSRK